jgi:hypothetical protein
MNHFQFIFIFLYLSELTAPALYSFPFPSPLVLPKGCFADGTAKLGSWAWRESLGLLCTPRRGEQRDSLPLDGFAKRGLCPNAIEPLVGLSSRGLCSNAYEAPTTQRESPRPSLAGTESKGLDGFAKSPLFAKPSRGRDSLQRDSLQTNEQKRREEKKELLAVRFCLQRNAKVPSK